MIVLSTQPLYTKGEHLTRRPSHNSFYATAFSSIDESVRVVFRGHERGSHAWRNLLYLCSVLTTRHDVLYAPINSLDLYLVILLRALGLYRKPVFIWKYTETKQPKGIKGLLVKLYYKGVDRVYMLSRTHYDEAVAAYPDMAHKFAHVPYAVDNDFYSPYASPQRPLPAKFTIVSTGADTRDFRTLCEAAEGLDVNLHVFTTTTNGPRLYREYLTSMSHRLPRLRAEYMEDVKERGGNVLESINTMMSGASAVAVCCMQADYGVGYTSVVEALPFGRPILLTANRDIPLDVEAEGCGFVIAPYDTQGWHRAIKTLAENPHLTEEMGKKALQLSQTRFRGKSMAEMVLKEMREACR